MMVRIKENKYRDQETSRKSLSYIIPIIFSVALAVGVWFMMMYQQVYSDDLEYGLAGYDSRHGIIDFINWKGIWNHIILLYQECNSRLIDKLPVVILSIAPKWLYSAISSAFVILVIVGIWKGAGISVRKNPWLALAATIALTLCFPWHETMFMLSYSINYLWTSAIAVWIALLFISRRVMGNGSIWALLLLFILGILIGNLHEAMAACLIAGFGIASLYSRSAERRSRMALTLGLIAGFVTATFFLATSYRLGYTGVHFHVRAILSGRMCMPSQMFWPVAVYTLLAIVYRIAWITNGRGKFLSSSLLFWKAGEQSRLFLTQVICLAVAWTDTLIYGFFKEDRIMAFAVVFSIIGCIQLIKVWPGGFSRAIRYIFGIMVSVLSLLLSVNFICSILLQKRIHQKYQDITKIWENSDGNIAYYDVSARIKTPIGQQYTFQMVYDWPLDNMYQLNAYIAPHRTFRQLYVIPTDLQNFSDSEVTWFDREKSIYKIHNHLLVDPQGRIFEQEWHPDSEPSQIHINMYVHFSDGSQHRVWGLLAPFDDAKGRRRYLIKTETFTVTDIEQQITKIDDINIIPQQMIKVNLTSYGTVDLFPYADKPEQRRVGNIILVPNREQIPTKHIHLRLATIKSSPYFINKC